MEGHRWRAGLDAQKRRARVYGGERHVARSDQSHLARLDVGVEGELGGNAIELIGTTGEVVNGDQTGCAVGTGPGERGLQMARRCRRCRERGRS